MMHFLQYVVNNDENIALSGDILSNEDAFIEIEVIFSLKNQRIYDRNTND